MQQRKVIMCVALMAALLLTACAPAGYSAHEYGFFAGIWHGAIAGFALTAKIVGFLLNCLNDDWGNWNIGLWADNNTGFGYALGYAAGLLWIAPLLRSR